MTDYPSDAPLPRFLIAAAKGIPYGAGSYCKVVISASLVNNKELLDYFCERYNIADRTWPNTFVFFTNHEFWASAELQRSKFGANIGTGDGGTTLYFESINCGRWFRLELLSIAIAGMSETLNLFEPQLYVCDVYVPSLDSMTPDVWTDLQFRQTEPPAPTPFDRWWKTVEDQFTKLGLPVPPKPPQPPEIPG